jgi:hypothetical protein
MKSTLVFLLVILLATVTIAADFSGSWALNKDKSELGEGRRGRMAATKLVVAQKENSLLIESTRTGRNGEERIMKDEMTLDGKETKSSTDWAETVSTAKMDKDVLLIFTSRTFERNGESFEMKSEQKWMLDDGGKSLIIDLKTNSSRGERVMKLVYAKE